MPKCSLTAYKSKARRIMRDIKALPQKEICLAINEKQTTVSYRVRNVYPTVMEDMVRILDLAGYEIVEKGEEE